MLKEIYIENFALISQLHIDINRGFTVITGETGSGKSIIIDAISLCLGRRGSKEFVRHGEDKAIIERRLENLPKKIEKELSEIGIDTDGQLIVTRELQKDGSSVSRMNRRMVPVSVLKSVMMDLITIHGQNEYESITQTDKQLQLLDNFGKSHIQGRKQEYSKLYTEYMELLQRIDKLSEHKDSGQLTRELDLLYYQRDEIESAMIQDGEFEKLEEEKRKLLHFEKIQDSFNEVYSLLSKNEQNAMNQLNESISILSSVEPYSNFALNCREVLQEAYYMVEDISVELGRCMAADSYDEEQLDDVISRLDLLTRLYRKYGGDYHKTKQYYEEVCDRIYEIEKREDLLKDYLVQREKLEHRLLQYAKILQSERKKVASSLEKRMIKELSTLNLKNTKYEIRFFEKSFSENGIDDVSFFISFNVGEEPKPFHKIASGGEISRFMLALKNIISTTDEIDTMIFDEIDTGVSGVAANQIGEKLQEIGQYKQVLCITHLPQIASFGAQHLLVAKEESRGSMNTHIYALTKEDRIREIAKMTVGENVTPISLENASELLHKNQKERELQ